MEFEDAVRQRAFGLGPAHHGVIGTTGPDAFAALAVVEQRWRPGFTGDLARIAVLQPVGHGEDERVQAMALEDRIGMHVVVEIGVVEGEQHRTRRQGAAGEEVLEIGGARAMVAGAGQPRHLRGKMLGRHRHQSGLRADVVIHQDGQSFRRFHARSRSFR